MSLFGAVHETAAKREVEANHQMITDFSLLGEAALVKQARKDVDEWVNIIGLRQWGLAVPFLFLAAFCFLFTAVNEAAG